MTAAPGSAPVPVPVPAPGSALEGGFAQPPLDAARAFRALLDALSRPGRINRLPGATPPAPFPEAAGALALALCDGETPVWLAPELRAPDLRAWLTFHCNAALTEDAAEAAFAFGAPAALAEALDAFSIGSPEYPDASATLVVLLPGFEGAPLTLAGPGIDGAATLTLPEAVAALHAPNRALFPQGRDLFLVAGDRVAGLPRTTRITRKEG
ncbi:alpha-D-ribose 1-methylphosphonate 5-triphosphate synthase subunit PhnH [Albimonas donghaensis]|uniref:Alpha-D-ribose 1-methylphosphonate 5-triphosphate synthase subunit PhnH n=1 Tax=Albimonas donghaensis TaxID=356660 RepID=A0A1H2THV2_9RHOB|nr:phosphonate C-P lyase system protein PhnH [Albimonas donghaensis]SDW42854.1 alpha-D-ribose 1-methylphosphonate 5-triphosphate synthase subunit PhnH [Albimonas donghaensis]